MNREASNIADKFSLFDDRWTPRGIAEMNDYQFKLARNEGQFLWHDHKDTDEAFIVIDGELWIAFRDGHVGLSAGEMYVVPQGVEHRPVANGLVHLMLIEPRGTVNTGDAGGNRAADSGVWI